MTINIRFLVLLLTLAPLLSATLAAAKAPAKSSAKPRQELAAEYKKTQLRRFVERAAEAAEENTLAKTAEAVARLRLVANEYRKAPAVEVSDSDNHSPHSLRNPRAVARHDFFVWRFLFSAAQTLNARGELPRDVLAGIEPIARENVRPRERAPNNRSFHFALGAIYSATLFPDAPEAATWRAYANAVFDDWLSLGDAVEPGYVRPWFPPLLELGVALHREADLRGPVARAMYARMRDHISASGLARLPGDTGGGGDQAAYVEGLALASEITGDASLLGAAKRALAATPRTHENYSLLERAVKKAEAAFPKTDANIPPAQPLAEIQSLFATTTHPVPDRMILSAPSAPASPYAAFYIMDRTETYHHGHEDTRGALYHYEADGVMLLRSPGWIKWAACTNTFVVADQTAQFPFALTRGLTPHRWLPASTWITPMRDIAEDAVWKRTGTTPVARAAFTMVDTATNLGYSIINMSGYTGAHDSVELREITLRFLAIPEKEVLAAEAANNHDLSSLSFDADMAWYRDYRPIAPAGADGTLTFLVSNLRLAGMDQSRTIAAFDTIPENMTVVHYAPGTRGQPGRVVPRAEWEKWLRIVPAGQECDGGPKSKMKNVLRVVCPPGRLELVFKPKPELTNIAKDLPRVEFDYQVLTPDATLLRLPMAIAINGFRLRSMYLDNQQGGRLIASTANQKNGDSFGSVTYENVYAAGATWTRRVVLTGEGIMIVADEYKAAEKQYNAVAGPVWQLPASPLSGLNWFSAPARDNPKKSLLVYFHPQTGVEYGVQYKTPILIDDENHAVFSKGNLRAGEKRTFLTVLVPHDTALSPQEITGSTNKNMRLFDVPRERLGIQTKMDADGGATIRIAPKTEQWPHKPLTVKIGADGSWSVAR